MKRKRGLSLLVGLSGHSRASQAARIVESTGLLESARKSDELLAKFSSRLPCPSPETLHRDGLYAEGREHWRRIIEGLGKPSCSHASVLLVHLARERNSFDAQKAAAVDAIAEYVARMPK